MDRKAKRAHVYTSDVYRELLRRVATNVKRLRAARDWSQDEAAHESGMVLQLYQRVEAGTTNFTAATIARLVEGFEIDARELFRARR